MPDPAFSQQVATIEELLRLVSRLVRRRGREILSHFDITPPQFDALLILVDNPGLTMSELCQRMYLACSTVTDLTDRMERGQLLERVRDEEDRRVTRLYVTSHGLEVREAVLRARRRYLAGVLAQMEAGELAELARSLQRVYDLMA